MADRPSWARIKELFAQALDCPPDQRQSFVTRATAGDPELRRELEALLAAHDTSGDFLEQTPAIDPDDIREIPPGTAFGSYTILRELGRGGSGIVYLAEDGRLGRQVALKLVAAVANPELRDRLRREARAAATITHPSIATIYALEEFDDQLFIVSEYVPGKTLRTALIEGRLSRERVLEIARDIARALRAAHAAGVVHRDLKPENVLLSDSGTVKVVDFGIARVIGDRLTQLTRHGALLGTPAYMAPEQLLGTPADARADIYAFGVVLSEMLAGRHPGSRPTTDSPPVSDHRLTAIAQRCTQLDPAARIQTAVALVDLLENAEADGDQTRTSALWWWQFHQAVTAGVYWVALWPAWLGRVQIGGSLGRIFFIVVLAAVVVSGTLRLHLWFTSRFYPPQLSWVRKRTATWIALGDAVFALALAGGGLLIHDDRSSIDVVLLSIGLGAGIGFLLIEGATTRAAFGTAD